MSKRPAAKRETPEPSPEGKALLADAENPRREPQVIWDKDAHSPTRSKGGQRRRGAHVIAPESMELHEQDVAPRLGTEPLVEVMVVRRARNGSAWQFQVGRVVDPSALAGLELADAHDSGVVKHHHGGIASQEALHAMHERILNAFGIPALLERAE